MKNYIVFAALALSALSVSAQTSPEIQTVKITAGQGESELSKTYLMLSEQFAKFKGAYTMKNGMTLSVFEIDRARFAQIDDEEKHEIVATAANAFAANDKKMKMNIDLGDRGQASGEVFYLFPGINTSEGYVTGSGWMKTALNNKK
ncbi:MAG: hypothetical protein V4447_00010 [Pseudomonadota bacterium]